MAVGKHGVCSWAGAALIALGCLLLSARPALAADWETYLNDDFSSAESMFFTGQAGEAFYSIDDQGRYIINGLDTTSDSLSALTDGMYYYYLEASVELLSSKAENLAFAGLVFHYNKKLEDKLSYYVFYVYSDGYYGAKRVVGDQVDIIIPLTMSDQITPGQANILGVDAQGTRFDLYINGKFVNGFTDVRVDGGGFGFYISKQSEAAFDDFSVRIEKKPGGKESENPANMAEEGTQSFDKYAPPYIPRDPKRPVYPWEAGVDKTHKKSKVKGEETNPPPEGEGVEGPVDSDEGAGQAPPEGEEQAKPPPEESGRQKSPPKKTPPDSGKDKSKPKKNTKEPVNPPPKAKPTSSKPKPATPASKTPAAKPKTTPPAAALPPEKPAEPETPVEESEAKPSDITFVPQEELDEQDKAAGEVAVTPAGSGDATASPEAALTEPETAPEDAQAEPVDSQPADQSGETQVIARSDPETTDSGTSVKEVSGAAEKPADKQPAKPEEALKTPADKHAPKSDAAPADKGDDLDAMRQRQGDWLESEPAPAAPAKDMPAKEKPKPAANADKAASSKVKVKGKPDKAAGNEPELPLLPPADPAAPGDKQDKPVEKEQTATREAPGSSGTEPAPTVPAEIPQPPAEDKEAVDVAAPAPAEQPTPAAQGTKLTDLPSVPALEAPAAPPAAEPPTPVVPDSFTGRAGLVEIADDFSEARWPVSENDSCTYRYFGEAYEIDNKKAGTMAISFQQNALADMDLSCDLEYLDGLSYVGYGLAARFSVQDGQVSYYGLFVSQSGEFLLLKVVDSKETVLQDWTAAPQLHPNQPNSVQLVLLGNQIQAYINAKLVASVTDDGLASGGYALLVGPGTAARFDSLSLRGIPAQ